MTVDDARLHSKAVKILAGAPCAPCVELITYMVWIGCRSVIFLKKTPTLFFFRFFLHFHEALDLDLDHPPQGLVFVTSLLSSPLSDVIDLFVGKVRKSCLSALRRRDNSNRGSQHAVLY